MNTHLKLDLNVNFFSSSGNALLCGLDIHSSKVSRSTQNLDIVVAEATTSDGQKLTKKLATNSLTNFFSYTNSLTI